MQHRRWLDRQRRVDLDQVAEAVEQRPGDRQADLDSLVITDVGERPFDLAAQVPGDPIRRLRRPQRPLLARQSFAQPVELRLQCLGDERLLEPRPQLLHTRNLRRDRDRGVGHRSTNPLELRACPQVDSAVVATLRVMSWIPGAVVSGGRMKTTSPFTCARHFACIRTSSTGANTARAGA